MSLIVDSISKRTGGRSADGARDARLPAVGLVVSIWVAARIYSAGVLLYGQRPGWRQVLRATRVAR